MTPEEAAQLKKAYADLKEQAAQKDQRIEELEGLLMGALLRIEELERRQAKDSHNSSKPPSSDGLGRKLGKPHKKSAKRSGGQPGHQGHTLMQVPVPDSVVVHRPKQCEECHFDLCQQAGTLKERRQVHDVPDLRLRVQEHQIEEICWMRS